MVTSSDKMSFNSISFRIEAPRKGAFLLADVEKGPDRAPSYYFLSLCRTNNRR